MTLHAIGRCIAWALAHVGVAAHKEACLVAQFAAVVKVEALFVVTQTCGDAHRAAWLFTSFGDEVDDAAWCVGAQCGSRTTTNHFEALKAAIGAQEHVGCGKSDVTEHQNGQTIFLELHITCAAGRDGQATNGHVGVTTTAARLGANTWNGAQDVGSVGGLCLQNLIHAHG